MKQHVTWFALVMALAMVGGCAKVNRIYKQDTGEMPAVPGPPPAESYQPTATTPGAPAAPGAQGASTPTSEGGVEFSDPAAPAAEAEPAAPVVKPMPVPVKPRTYTIKKGDSYWKIAKELYGQGSRAKDLEAANPGVNPNALPIGEEILVPD